MANIIRIQCGLEGHEQDWIEFNTSDWTLADYREIFYAPLPEALRRWVEVDSSDWHLTGLSDAIIPHPGRGAPRSQWMAAYRALGDEGLKLGRWMALSALEAVHERIDNPKKSEAGGTETGDGGKGPGAARDSDGATG